jgi:choline transport protein
MIEEIPNPTVEGPKIMIGCVAIGILTGFVFLSVLLFVLSDVETVISSSAGPILQILFDATANRAGSICLLMYAFTLQLLANPPFN